MSGRVRVEAVVAHMRAKADAADRDMVAFTATGMRAAAARATTRADTWDEAADMLAEALDASEDADPFHVSATRDTTPPMKAFAKATIPLIEYIADNLPEVRVEAYALAEKLRAYVAEASVGPTSPPDPG